MFVDLIGEIEKHLFEHRGHQRGKSPIYSLSNLEKGFFRLVIFYIVVTCLLSFLHTTKYYFVFFLSGLLEKFFSVSLAQGGPAPRFLRPWCFDYLSSGDVDESTLTIDDVDDAELYNLIKKVVIFFQIKWFHKSFISTQAHHLPQFTCLCFQVEEEETDLSAWNDQIINCGFTGAIKPENKEAIIRSEKVL